MNSKIRKIFIVLVAMLMVISSGVYAFADGVEDDVDHTSVLRVNDYSISGYGTCSGMGGMEIVGDDLYCIKTNSLETATTLIRTTDFATNPVTTNYPIEYNGNVVSLGHANGIAYYKEDGATKGNFYIATMKLPNQGSQIIAVAWNGEVTKNITCEVPVTSIATIGDGHFIVGANKDSTKRIYYAAHLSGNTMILDEVFYVSYESGYTGNDILYYEGYLYVPLFKKEADGHIHTNKIYTIDLTNGISQGTTYSSIRTMVDVSPATVYEIEGMDIYNGKKYVCTNVKYSDNTTDDRIFKLYKPAE